MSSVPLIRALLVLAGLSFVACSDDAAETRATSETRQTSEQDETETEVAPELPSWSEPAVRVLLDRRSARRSVEVTLDEARPDAQVDVRTALGPVAPGCEAGVPANVTVSGAAFAAEIPERASATVCVRDSEGNVRARAEVGGWRSFVYTRFEGDDERVMAELSVAPLDDDVEAVVFVAFEAREQLEQGNGLDTIRCIVEPGYPDDEDAPEHCAHDCSSGTVVGEVPRAVVERLLASPAYRREDTSGEIHRPDALAIRVPVDLGERALIHACVRTRAGNLETSSRMPSEPTDGWYGCLWDTPSGDCTYGANEVKRGDMLTGVRVDGERVFGEVRRARTRREYVLSATVGGRRLELGRDELVRGSDGSDVRGRDLQVGTLLWHGGSPLAVEVVEQPVVNQANAQRWTQVDIAGAPYISRNGFAVRDLGPADDASDDPARDAPFEVGPGPADCSIEARWVAASTSSAVSLAVRPAPPRNRFGRTSAECESPLMTIDADSLEAVASLGPHAQIVARLAGDSVECDSDYLVSLCGEGLSMPALWAQATPWCLPAGTMIETLSGPRAIEALRRGDRVRSFDGGETVATVLDLYTHDDRPLLEIRLEDGTLLEATAEHLILVGDNHEARRAGSLRAGDLVHVHSAETDSAQVGRREGKTESLAIGTRARRNLVPRRIISVQPGRRARVYELRVSAPDTYFANGVLVHNY